MKKLISLTYLEFKNCFKSHLVFQLSIISAMILLLLSNVYFITLDSQLLDTYNSYATSISSSKEISDEQINTLINSSTDLEYILATNYDFKTTKYFDIDKLELIVDNNKYNLNINYPNKYNTNCINDESIYSYNCRYRLDITSYYNNNLYLSKNEILELESKDFNSELIIEGSNINNDYQILLNEYLVRAFGLDKDLSNYINKNISIIYDNHYIVDNYELVGIVNSDIYELDVNKNFNQIIVSDNFNGSEYLNEENYINLYSLDHNNIALYSNELIGGFNPPINGEYFELIDDLFVQKEILSKILLLLSITLYLAIIVYNLIEYNKYYDSKSRYLTILRTIGISSKQLNIKYLIECILSFIVSLVITFMIGIGISSILLNVLSLDFNILLFIKSYIIIGIFLLIYYLIIYINFYIYYKNTEVYDLLKD